MTTTTILGFIMLIRAILDALAIMSTGLLLAWLTGPLMAERVILGMLAVLLTWVGVGFGVLAFLVAPLLRRMMHGVR